MTVPGGLGHVLGSLSKVATSTGARLVGTMGLYALLARALGPNGFGQFTYWYATGILLAALSDFGFGQRVLMSLASGHADAIRESFSSLLFARYLTIAGAFVAGLVWALAGSADWREWTLAALLLAACLVASVFEFLGAVMRARGDYGLETRQAILSAFVGNLLAGVAGYATQSALVAAAVMLAFRTLAIGAQLRVVARQLGFTGPLVQSRHRQGVVATLHSGLPFTADGIAVQSVGYVDILFARLLMSEHSFGVYMAGSRLLQAVLTGIPVMASVFVPNMVRALHDPVATRRHRAGLYALCVLAGTAFGGILLVSASWIGTWLFGHSFTELNALLPLFGLAVAARYYAAAPALELSAQGLQFRRMWVNIVCALLFIVGVMFLPPEPTSLRPFVWLFCGLGFAQLALFGLARLLPSRTA